MHNVNEYAEVGSNGSKTMARFLPAVLFITLMASGVLCSTVSMGQDKKVLVIGIDGLMPDAAGSPYTPHINTLFDGFERGSGKLLFGYTEDLTFSGPSWSTIFTGVHHDRHQVKTNSYDGHDFSNYPHFLKRLKQHNPDLYTAAFVTWNQLPNNFQTPDGTPDGVDTLVFHSRIPRPTGDSLVTQAVVDLLKNGNPDAIFYYQNDIDGAGHSYGFSVDIPEYREQVQITDARVGKILKALRARPGVLQGEEEWLVIVVTDHGGEGTGHRGNLFRQRFVPLIVSGTSNDFTVERSHVRPRTVDVSRTVLSFMDVPEEKFAELDGHNLLKPVARPEPGFGVNLIINGDGEYDRGFTDTGMDQVISGWMDQGHTGHKDGWHSMTVLKFDSPNSHIGPEGSPVDRSGSNVFTGGSKGNSSKITQILDVSSLRSEVDRRKVAFHLSGFLGGKNDSRDHMVFTAYFLDEDHNLLHTAILESVTYEDRKGETQLIYREAKDILPRGTVSIKFELHALGMTGEGVDALADKLSFSLIRNE
jgi:hypothetical protein